MDFIERLFGFSPDGGSGSLELAFVLVPIIAGLLVWRIYSQRSGPKN